MKRIFIIHGYKSFPTDCWFPWLKDELIKRGFTVYVPRFTNSHEPKFEKWLETIREAVGIADENTYFIGHSLGAIAIIRYLQTLKKEKIGGAVFVAGRVIFRPRKTSAISGFFETPIRWSNVKKVTGKTIGVYSIDDPFVSIENGRLLEQKLGTKLVLEKNKGHFSRDDAVLKLPIVLKNILSIMN
ncbi:MAG: alpha/beta hydrolase [Candidatus Sungbacteria bacterium]|nr:alpha/beta hydrolase [Candidatus Sungbacteria bacterium]